MRRIPYLALLLGALLALLLFMPASWLAAWVRNATNSHVWLSEAEGSVWSGSSRLILNTGSDADPRAQAARLLPGRVSWSLRPSWSESRPAFKLALLADCCAKQDLLFYLMPSIGQQQVLVQIPDSTWPAELLEGLGTPWNTMELRGDLRMQAPHLLITSGSGRISSQGSAKFELLRAESALSGLKPMGSYQLNLTGDANPEVKLHTLEGGLQLNGQGQWVAGKFHFEGRAEAAPGYETQLNNLLNVIGKRDGNGVRLRFG